MLQTFLFFLIQETYFLTEQGVLLIFLTQLLWHSHIKWRG